METTKIKQALEKILELMSVSYEEIEEKHQDDMGRFGFVVKTNDADSLIGVKGANLYALNLILKKIAFKDKKDEEKVHFYVDVNNYQEKTLEDLRNKVEVMAERARSFGVDVPLPPMSSYERMMVHTFLQNMKDVKTESEGFGRNRKVVIKYVKN